MNLTMKTQYQDTSSRRKIKRRRLESAFQPYNKEKVLHKFYQSVEPLKKDKFLLQILEGIMKEVICLLKLITAVRHLN